MGVRDLKNSWQQARTYLASEASVEVVGDVVSPLIYKDEFHGVRQSLIAVSSSSVARSSNLILECLVHGAEGTERLASELFRGLAETNDAVGTKARDHDIDEPQEYEDEAGAVATDRRASKFTLDKHSAEDED